MPAIFNVQLNEIGEVYQVVNVIMTESKYILPNAKYVALPNEVALTIMNELNQGNLISIKKELIDSPKNKDIPLEDFNITKPNTLNQLKSAAKSKVHQKISGYAALLTGFDMLEFWIISTKLTSMGYNVMDESNKEEVFLSIINTGDEYLITELERFLEVKDIFDKMMKKYRGLKQYFREIDDCDTDEELKEAIENNKGWLVN